MVNLDWHLKGIGNYLGEEMLDISVRDYLGWFIEIGDSPTVCGTIPWAKVQD